MKIVYPLRVHKADEGGFWAEFPDLPGCITEGDTLEETLHYAREALNGWITSRFERGFKVPAASTIKGKNIYRIEPSPEICVPLLLRKVRAECGLSQSAVAKKLSITYQTYQSWESPKAANPTVKQLDKVAKAIGKKLVVEIV